MFESDIDNAFENRYAPKEELPEEGAVAIAGKKTQETLTASDNIIDALDMAEAELKRLSEHEVCNMYPNNFFCFISLDPYIYTYIHTVLVMLLWHTEQFSLICILCSFV